LRETRGTDSSGHVLVSDTALECVPKL
jgi:hypothetical protein